MCIHSVFEIAKSQGTCRADTKGWQSQQAQHKRHNHCHDWCFAIAIIYTKCEITRFTSNAICLSRTAPKQAKTSRLKALSHYSSWPSCFAACLNDDWHVHAGRTITAASALQIGMKIACSSGKVCFVLRGCLAAKSQIMSLVKCSLLQIRCLIER